MIGVIFAAMLMATCELDWVCHLTLLPVLIAGLTAMAALLLFLQSRVFFSSATSKPPDPHIACLRNRIGHSAFGIGVCLAAVVSVIVTPGQ